MMHKELCDETDRTWRAPSCQVARVRRGITEFAAGIAASPPNVRAPKEVRIAVYVRWSSKAIQEALEGPDAAHHA